MRALLVTPYFAPAWRLGGAVQVADTLAAGLAGLGVDVTVVTTDVTGERTRFAAGEERRPDGVRVVRFRNVSTTLAERASGWMPAGLARWLRAEVPRHDVVHVLDFYSLLCFGAVRAGARAGVPSVVQPQGSLPASRARGRALPKRAFRASLGGRILRDASALAWGTEVERGDWEALGARPEQLTHLLPPLPLPAPSGVAKAGAPTVVCVARHHPVKGVDRVLEAAARVREHVPSVRFELVGPDAGHGRALRRLAERLQLGSSLEFTGPLPPPEAAARVEAAHVSCLLSRSEALPRAALESFALGVPAVLSPECHMPEAHDRCALVADAETPAAAAAIARLLGDEALRARLGAAGPAVAAPFAPDVVLPRLVELYDRLAA